MNISAVKATKREISEEGYLLIKNNIEKFRKLPPPAKQLIVTNLKYTELLRNDSNLGLGMKILLFITKPERKLKSWLKNIEKSSKLVISKDAVRFLVTNFIESKKLRADLAKTGSQLKAMGVNIK